VNSRDCIAEQYLVASVQRLSELIGLPDRDCLQRSLLLYRLLSRSGAAPKLMIGFRQTEGKVLGHAWVTVDGQPIMEDVTLLPFSPAFGFGQRGAFLTTAES
jgi:hypothetical protein